MKQTLWPRTSWFYASLILIWISSGYCAPADPDVGQMLMVGFNETKVTPDLLSHLKHIKPGAIILFRRNIQSPEQLTKLIRTLKHELDPVLETPLLFAIDQEGGSVYRIPTNPRLPSPAALGKSNDPKLVEEYGFVIGKLLRQNGISMNLAPVLDLDLATEKNFIGSRSFGTDPSLVAQMGYLFSKGLAAAGVIPTGKHFPGLGKVINDPHQSTPISALDWKSDWNHELLPFRAFSRLMPSALMLAHVIYPKLDHQRLPASISPYIIKKVLRESFQYQGLIVTDDLLMKGITDYLDPSDAAIASVNSGADLVMISWSKHDQLSVYDGIKRALQTATLSRSDLNERIARIRKIKQLIGLSELPQQPKVSWESHEIRELNQKLLQKTLSIDLLQHRKINISPKEIWLLNLNQSWHPSLARRFPAAHIQAIKSLDAFQKLHPEQRSQHLLLVGVAQRETLTTIKQLSLNQRSNVILILTQDLPLERPETYRSVFAPLWSFEGIPQRISELL
jgi:beta-glucosidase-like glycosyl hydrolase